MWVITYEVNDYNQYGEYYQHSWFTKPDVTYLACYLKHAKLVDKDQETWFTRELAQQLHDGQLVQLGICVYHLWEQQHLGPLEMY